MSWIDSTAKRGVGALQDYAILSGRAVAGLVQRPLYLGELFIQADIIGVGSLPIVALAGGFTGAVLALQTASSLEQFGATAFTGQFVSLSMIKELGPVLTSLMVSGRNASGMASELGSMVVTEQIDAMRSLGTDPMKKLVAPRVIASVAMLFFLTIVSDVVGTVGGAGVSIFLLGQDAGQYFHSAYEYLKYSDIVEGLVKPLLFGFIIATIGCFYGMRTRGGTQGVGRSTTQAVVVASVLIIVTNFVLSRLAIGLFGS
jgi:phospholipid/cholesterol/gamma-HCH transport system permease protein